MSDLKAAIDKFTAAYDAGLGTRAASDLRQDLAGMEPTLQDNVEGCGANPVTALKRAIDHIEHMAAFIGSLNAGYSFESLGEDMPEMKTAFHSPSHAWSLGYDGPADLCPYSAGSALAREWERGAWDRKTAVCHPSLPEPHAEAPHGWVCFNAGPTEWFWSEKRDTLEHEFSGDIRPATHLEKYFLNKQGDQTHEHGSETKWLRKTVERAQAIISTSIYPNWHEAARAALDFDAHLPPPAPDDTPPIHPRVEVSE